MELENSYRNTSDPVQDVSDPVLPGLISDDLYWHLMTLVLVLDVLTAVVATIANIITIIVYHRLGYSDTTNISLTALAISDMGVAVTAFTSVLAITLPLIPKTPFTFEMFFTSGVAPHVTFLRISALITTYLSIERYLCVSLPLKVKGIFTPRRTFIAMLVIFLTTSCFFPFVVMRFPVGWIFSPSLNRTMISILPVTDETRVILFNIYVTCLSFILPALTFTTVVFTTILLSLSLEKSKRWRDANKSSHHTILAAAATSPVDTGGGTTTSLTTSSSETTTSASKETRAVKMVIAITTVFILSTIPSCVHMIVQELVPGFFTGGRYSNVHLLSGMAFLTTDSLNCSANVIIYYKMSSKFRLALRGLFSGKNK